MNPEQNKVKRAEYVLNQNIQQGKQMAWIDETNFILFYRRTRGRARTDVKAVA